MFRNFRFGIFLLFLFSRSLYAAPPTWSVDAGAFDYGMSMTVVLNQACEELKNPNNKIAAFVGADVRGVVNSATVINDRYMALLPVYSNLPSGETVTFKIYNAVTDQVVDAVTTVIFQDDAVFGSPSAPFPVYTVAPPTGISFTPLTVTENLPIGTLVGTLAALGVADPGAFGFSFVSGTGSTHNDKFSIVGNEVRTSAVFDYELTNQYSVRINTGTGPSCSVQQVFTVGVTDVNDAPHNITLSDTVRDENLKKDQLFATITVADQDLGDSHVLTLVAGAGDEENAYFRINNNQLLADTLLDFEHKATYRIRMQASDLAGAVFTKTFVLRVRDINDAPTNIILSATSVAENMPVGTVVATLSTADQDAGDTHVYSFENTPGNNNDQFTIVGNQLRTAAMFDFETKNEYILYIKTTDAAGLSFVKLVNLMILDANDAPTNISISANSVDEAQVVGTFVALLTTADVDAGDTHTYALVSGEGASGNTAFSVSNDSLFTAQVLDFNNKNSYSIRLQTNDGNGGTFTKVFTVSVNDINDAPTNINLSNASLAENNTIGKVIGILSTVDKDVTDNHTYTLVAGVGDDDNTAFSISGNQLTAAIRFDFEVKNSYTCRIATTDKGGLTFEKAFVITIADSNDAPTNILLTATQVAENLPLNTLVGTLSTVDQDAVDAHSYSFQDTPGNNNDKFTIVGAQLRTAAMFDFETKAEYFVYIKTTDAAGLTFTKLFIIEILDANDAPHDILLSSASVSESKPMGTFIGVLTTEDVDAADTHTYSFVAGTGAGDNARFVISNDSLLTNEIFDVNVRSNYSVRIQSNDGNGGTFAKVFVITITETNNAPTGILLSGNTITENNLIGKTIGLFTAVDKDATDTHTFALIAGDGDDDNSAFSIVGNQLRAGRRFDYETKNSFSIRVIVRDKENETFEKSFSILVSDTNDAPHGLELSTTYFYENLPLRMAIASISTLDQDTGDTHFYTFFDFPGNDNASFLIFGNQLLTNAMFDYETRRDYLIGIRTTDASGATFEKSMLVFVLDTNDAPTGLFISDSVVNEHLPEGSFVALLSAADPDATDNFSYSLVGGSGFKDNEGFKISGDSLLTNKVLNYNEKSNYSIQLQVADKGNLTFRKTFTITVRDVNRPPSNVFISDTVIAENLPKGSVLGQLSVEDEDQNDTHIYSMPTGFSGYDNKLFYVEGNTVYSNAAFDFEQKNQYKLLVRVRDGSGENTDKEFIISILDVNEKPSLVAGEYFLPEDASVGFSVGSVSATDPDAESVFTYTVLPQNSRNVRFSINALTGELLMNYGTPDYFSESEYLLQVVVTDNGVPSLADTGQVVIKVQNKVGKFLPSSDYVSPNGDGINDTWFIENVELYADFSLKIFDASGLMVYSVGGNYDNSWNGVFRGADLPSGAYYYVFQDRGSTGKVFKGTISLVR